MPCAFVFIRICFDVRQGPLWHKVHPFDKICCPRYPHTQTKASNLTRTAPCTGNERLNPNIRCKRSIWGRTPKLRTTFCGAFRTKIILYSNSPHVPQVPFVFLSRLRLSTETPRSLSILHRPVEVRSATGSFLGSGKFYDTAYNGSVMTPPRQESNLCTWRGVYSTRRNMLNCHVGLILAPT